MSGLTVNSAAASLLSHVTPAIEQLTGRIDSLQQQQATLGQSLRESKLVDEEALAKVE